MVPCSRTRVSGHKVKQMRYEVLPEHKEKMFYYEGDGALAQVACRDCEIPILEDTNKSSVCSCGQFALDGCNFYSPFIMKLWKFWDYFCTTLLK